MQKFLIAILFLTISFVSQAFDRQDFIDSCINVYKDGTKSYQIAKNEFGLTGEKADVIAYVIQNMVTNKFFLNYTYNKLVQQGFNLSQIKDKNELLNVVSNACISTFYTVMYRGLTRLSPEEHRFAFEYSLNTLKYLKARREYGLCRLQGLGANTKISIKELTRASKMIYKDVSVSYLRKYADLILKSFNAETIDFPRKKRLTAEEVIEIDSIYQNLLIERLQRMSQSDIERIIYAFSDLQGANAKDSCDAVILTLEAALDAKGDIGDKILLYILMED